MRLLETVIVFIGLKLKEVSILLLKIIGVILGVIIALVIVGGITLAVWKLFWPISADVQFFNNILKLSLTIGYFSAFLITAALVGLMETMAIVNIIGLSFLSWCGIKVTVGFLQSNWWEAKRIVLSKRKDVYNDC